MSTTIRCNVRQYRRIRYWLVEINDRTVSERIAKTTVMAAYLIFGKVFNLEYSILNSITLGYSTQQRRRVTCGCLLAPTSGYLHVYYTEMQKLTALNDLLLSDLYWSLRWEGPCIWRLYVSLTVWQSAQWGKTNRERQLLGFSFRDHKAWESHKQTNHCAL